MSVVWGLPHLSDGSSSPPDTSESDLKKQIFRNRAVIAIVDLLLVFGEALSSLWIPTAVGKT
tara:strand:- start:622 stop:807 length:186 start_codon:yes stop_codon:yes gene_type:complete